MKKMREIGVCEFRENFVYGQPGVKLACMRILFVLLTISITLFCTNGWIPCKDLFIIQGWRLGTGL